MSFKGKILIVEGNENNREVLYNFLLKEGYYLDVVDSGLNARKFFYQKDYDVVFLDLSLLDLEGLELLREFIENNSETPIIVYGQNPSIELIVSAIKIGAFDFISKPISLIKLKNVLEKALSKKQENINLKLGFQEKKKKFPFIGKSPAIRPVLEKAKLVASTDSTVLITGESGTGKGLLAQKIYEWDTVYKKAFICVDCSCIVPTLFESELFGHTKGSFTGAHSSKVGKIELAQGGTLFLDEIANIPLELQAKLLKVVEDKEFSPVGSLKVIKAKVRILAATNKNLKEEVKKGTFREDLYYRLNVVHLHLPPLRERKEDIPILADYFINYFSHKYKKPLKTLSPEVKKIFLEYSWPGNVRELKHLIERLIIFSKKEVITEKDLYFAGFENGQPFLSLPLKNFEKFPSEEILPLEEVEKNYILKTLEKLKWNKSLTAKKLGIDRKTLSEKLKKWGITNY